jgi:uncharacterized membrane protein YfcA
LALGGGKAQRATRCLSGILRPMDFALTDRVWLVIAAGFAGFVDAIVGGGGLIQIPALFSVLPQQSAATLFGTNKLSSVFGTANAAWRYTASVRMPWRTTMTAAVVAFFAAYGGAAAVAWLPREAMRPLILLLLVAAAAYTFWRKDFGALHRPRHAGRREFVLAILVGGVIGFYDGFFGPGTGSFLIFLFIRFFDFDFLHASAAAKVVNVATNLAALAYFVPNGYWLPVIGVFMALANVSGSWIGAHLALKRGAGFVRHIFLLVTVVLIVRFAWDTLH